jgi:sec-independent protein translocase protein TatA
MNLGPRELLVLLLIALLLFGAKRLPDLAQGMGKSLRIFKKEIKAQDETDSDEKPSNH